MGWSLTQATNELCAARAKRGGVFLLSQEDLALLGRWERRERRRGTAARRWEDRKFARWRRANPLPPPNLTPVDHTATTMEYARRAWRPWDDIPRFYMDGGVSVFEHEGFRNPFDHDGAPATAEQRAADQVRRDRILADMTRRHRA